MATNISTILINVDKEKVWRVLTQPNLVKEWQYGCELQTDWSVGSKIEFLLEWEGKSYRQWGTIMQFFPNERLTYTLFSPRPDLEDKPENYITMNYLLLDQGNQTTLEIVKEDNRENAVQQQPQGEENPVLLKLKELAESL